MCPGNVFGTGRRIALCLAKQTIYCEFLGRVFFRLTTRISLANWFLYYILLYSHSSSVHINCSKSRLSHIKYIYTIAFLGNFTNATSIDINYITSISVHSSNDVRTKESPPAFIIKQQLFECSAARSFRRENGANVTSRKRTAALIFLTHFLYPVMHSTHSIIILYA